MICFDSNSYLGLHLHPRVVGAVKAALDRVGFGTPSAQLLGGTNRYLRELEETVARFHGRAKAMIFPSGYAANLGVLTALLRKGDRVAIDRFSHASLHDGARASGARRGHVFPHLDVAALERQLGEPPGRGPDGGTLVATDGVFSMHGSLAPLPALRDLATRHNALLLVDEAHATGVMGATGRGLEEHYGLPGAIDVLVGTFSKAPGAMGGYVCGSPELVLHSAGAQYMLRGTLQELEARLDPRHFVRIHRSRIVNLDRVQELHPWSHGDVQLVLADGTRLMLSRRYRDRLPALGGPREG
jgi:7-keto-8-aminopelargonate synthetase-like enzyme